MKTKIQVQVLNPRSNIGPSKHQANKYSRYFENKIELACILGVDLKKCACPTFKVCCGKQLFNTPGTRVGPGYHDQTLAVKSRKKQPKI